MNRVTMTKELALELLDNRIMGIMSNLSEWETLGDAMPDDMREELETNLALYHMAYDAISGPTPDPETGLMPCGCGSKYVATETESEPYGDTGKPAWIAYCQQCLTATISCRTEDDAVKAWNAAMGFRES